MKLYLTDLKQLLNNIQRYQVKQVKVIDNSFELLINALKNTKTNIRKKQNFLTKYEHIENFKGQQPSINLNTTKSTKHVTIISPMVGTFYRASSPNESPFVKVLDKITIDQTVCIIEAMKLMNEIEAEVNGRIIDILVEDGDFVDCGQALMIVEPL
uniref:Biotin carboxyl carrier protein of acetyl-CoA carboxylase n=1 Tax=Hildenbrandia rubra TaxID=31481 RepID=A0A1C9CFW0_9FLOR|nr:acetyl-CoA carboxylase biotin carboxyl carrier protein [Hildenbrandia rubra]AOM67252.1 acetyl-CoA carboxylase biotin carboxyl carrier protein [Hildenbrandia rubra]